MRKSSKPALLTATFLLYPNPFAIAQSFENVPSQPDSLNTPAAEVQPYPDRGESHGTRAYTLGNSGNPTEALQAPNKAIKLLEARQALTHLNSTTTQLETSP